MSPFGIEQDHYAVLEVSVTANLPQIKLAYHRLALLYHPDKNVDGPDATAKTQAINLAWEVLRDTKTRATYDRKRAQANLSIGLDPYSAQFQHWTRNQPPPSNSDEGFTANTNSTGFEHKTRDELLAWEHKQQGRVNDLEYNVQVAFNALRKARNHMRCMEDEQWGQERNWRNAVAKGRWVRDSLELEVKKSRIDEKEEHVRFLDVVEEYERVAKELACEREKEAARWRQRYQI